MSRKLERVPFPSGDWWFWMKIRNPLKVGFSLAICSLATYMPFPEVKNWMLRLTGMKVGKRAFIAMGAALDIFYPELLEIGEKTIVGYGCVITAHELLQGELRVGKVVVGSECMLGTRSVVLPGVQIGNRASIGAMSLVNCDVPAGAFYAGVPAREIKKGE